MHNKYSYKKKHIFLKMIKHPVIWINVKFKIYVNSILVENECDWICNHLKFALKLILKISVNQIKYKFS